MIRIHYLDGTNIDVSGADTWRVVDGVLSAGTFNAPLTAVRGWQQLPTPGGLDSEDETSGV